MTRRKLGELAKGAQGSVTAIHHKDSSIRQRLMEMGFLEGSRVEILHEAPFGKDPIAVRVRGALIAVRRSDALEIEIE